MIKFYISESVKGYITSTDLLMNTGSLTFNIKISQIKNGGFIFNIESDKFIFNLQLYQNSFSVQRNNYVSLLTLDEIPIDKKILFILSWSFSSLNLYCKYGKEDLEILKSEIKTTPIAPPNELLIWCKKNNLLEIIEYESEEKFRKKIHSCLLSIQNKVFESGSFSQFWNIKYSGSKIISKEPKREIEVQPIIHSLLSDQLLMSSIEIIPEFKTSEGNLDFLFIGKVKNEGNKFFFVEFKNAHSNKLKEGLLNQLPTYMENKNINYGAYCVLNYHGDDNKEKIFQLSILLSKSENPYLKNCRIINFDLSKPISASKK